MSRYRLTDDAKADLKGIRSYLTQEAGKRVANSTVSKITAAFVSLGGSPGIGHSREDLTGLPVRFWSVFSYIIVYDPERRPIEILRILHGNRDLPALLGRDDT